MKKYPQDSYDAGKCKLRHVEIEKRNLELAEAANTLPINRVERQIQRLV